MFEILSLIVIITIYAIIYCFDSFDKIEMPIENKNNTNINQVKLQLAITGKPPHPIKVRVFGVPPSTQSLNSRYGDHNLIFVDDNSYEYAIVRNEAMPVLTIPPDKAFGIAHEPTEFLKLSPKFKQYVEDNLKYYLIGNTTNLPSKFISYYGYLFSYCSPKYVSYNDKPKIMSFILSDKQFLSGHKYRHQLCARIVDLNLPIDIYGRGSDKYNSKRAFGSFSANIVPYNDYKYTIAIENSTSSDYISEKYTSPVYFNTIPVYLGASNIQEYFGKDWGIPLIGDIDTDIQTLTDILSNPDKFEKDLTNSLYQLQHGKAHIKSLFFT